MFALLNSCNTGVLDMLWRCKVGLTYAKRDDVATFANQLVDLGQHHKGVFSAQTLGTLT